MWRESFQGKEVHLRWVWSSQIYRRPSSVSECLRVFGKAQPICCNVRGRPVLSSAPPRFLSKPSGRLRLNGNDTARRSTPSWITLDNTYDRGCGSAQTLQEILLYTLPATLVVSIGTGHETGEKGRAPEEAYARRSFAAHVDHMFSEKVRIPIDRL